MVEMLRPDIAIARQEFNRIMDDLAKIDPTTPAARL
jgi:hypothetical protein